MAYGILDTAMTGHANPTALAAMALASAIFISVFVGLTGVVHALIPFIAQQFGAKQYARIGHTWSQGVWLALVLSVAGSLVFLFPDVWLSFSGDVAPEVREQVSTYLRLQILTLPAGLLFRTIYALNTAISRPKMVMLINLSGVGLKAFFNWVFIYGNLGFAAYGAAGAAMSSVIVMWLSALIGLLLIWRRPFYKTFHLKFGPPDLKVLSALLKLGIPMGASYLIEVTAFTFMALLVAREGAYAVGGHQIMANLSAACYMMPLAMGIATSALVAQSLGAGQAEQARRIGQTGLVLCVAGAVLTIALVLGFRHQIIAGYTSDPQVRQLALGLLVLIATFHVLDALQCFTNYLLRAYKVAMVPMLIQAGALWGIGLFGGWALGYGPMRDEMRALATAWLPSAPPGAAILWGMAAVSMLLATVLLQAWYWRISYQPLENARDSI